jgi:hypothetical protein
MSIFAGRFRDDQPGREYASRLALAHRAGAGTRTSRRSITHCTPRRNAGTWSRWRRSRVGAFTQMGIPDVDEIDGIPPAVALLLQRAHP